ncbi:MAG: mannitol dehydrogenase family protein [Treponema sp.]|nr:mannitol dehydrogenase family protein [Treponema sp.]
MRLSDETIKDVIFWDKANISLPGFDRKAMIAATGKTPRWIHFGAGNIFRAFPASLAQSLLEMGIETTGIVVAEGYDGEIIDKCFLPFDNLCILVTLKSGGTTDKKVIASVASSLRTDKNWAELRKIFINPSLQMASFTITEKGYNLTGKNGSLLADIKEDINSGPGEPNSYLGRIAALCHERYVNGAYPLALVSMDNCSHNGDKLFAAMETFAKGWTEKNITDAGFLNYIRNRKKVSFPWTMIDKITPRPDESVRKMLNETGIEDMQDIVTEKNTYIAPYVNAEETQYLVMEDAFPNGRPALDKAGVLFTDRETVDKVEKMKVGTCLNPLHTALAVFGCLLGFKRISDEMKDPDLLKLAEGIGRREGMPVVIDPGIIEPDKFLDQVINVRLVNPFLPDTPQRIATDTSQKIPARFGGTLIAYKESGKILQDLKLIPLVFAGWLRYLLGYDDEGNPMNVSPDPLYENLKAGLDGIIFGQIIIEKTFIHSKLKPLLSNSSLFGLDLYEAGLAEKVENYFSMMISDRGAVRKILSIIVNE